LIADTEVTGGPATLDKMLSPRNGFPAFDGNRDGKLDATEWDVMRAMLAAENGLLAITLGGKGDVTAGAVQWKYTRPVPQVPSTLLYKGVLFMINDSGILLSIDPATGNVLKQGRLKGAIDKYFASPVGADGKVFLVSQDGTASVVDARAQWEILSVNPLDDEVFATPANRRRQDLHPHEVDALRLRGAEPLSAGPGPLSAAEYTVLFLYSATDCTDQHGSDLVKPRRNTDTHGTRSA